MNMTESEHRFDPGLATALRISVSRLARRLRVGRAAAGVGEPELSETQLAALATLERHGAMTRGELAEHEKVQPPSMTRVISVLVESQLVRREPHSSDRRQVMLTATEAGRDLVHKARRRREAGLARRPGEPAPAGQTTPRGTAAELGKLSQARPAAGPPPPPPGGSRRARFQTFRSLSTRNYRLFATGQVVSNTGTWMQRVAQDWLVLELTHGSGTALGIATGLQFLPQLLFSLWGGVIAD